VLFGADDWQLKITDDEEVLSVDYAQVGREENTVPALRLRDGSNECRSGRAISEG
jgi:hypothetical protein